jgi:pullulanase
MDVVYNHTFIAGQNEKSVLDRIVPGYYHRLNAAGAVERSTCCDNTATENLMMGKLMIDSVGAVGEALQDRLLPLRPDGPPAARDRWNSCSTRERGGRPHVQLIGEGWNFGEVADGARFVQASQLSLNGSGIGTFSDRTRDAVRGGSAGDSGEAMIAPGLDQWPGLRSERRGGPTPAAELLKAADMVRAGLAGSIRSYPLQTRGQDAALEAIDYGGQPAGYAASRAKS